MALFADPAGRRSRAHRAVLLALACVSVALITFGVIGLTTGADAPRTLLALFAGPAGRPVMLGGAVLIAFLLAAGLVAVLRRRKAKARRKPRHATVEALAPGAPADAGAGDARGDAEAPTVRVAEPADVLAPGHQAAFDGDRTHVVRDHEEARQVADIWSGEPVVRAGSVEDDKPVPGAEALAAAVAAAEVARGSADGDRGRGSLRRSQWSAPPDGPPDGDSGGQDEAGASPDGPIRRQVRRTALRITVVVVALLLGSVIVFMSGVIASTGSRGVPAKHAAAARHLPSPRVADLARINSAAAVTPSPVKTTATAAHKTPAAAPTPTPAVTARAAVTRPPAPHPVGSWPLDSRWGTVAVDARGAHPGTAANVQWCFSSSVGRFASFNGANSDITTAGPVLHTGPGWSFTVSAWVNLASTSHFETAVSQDGKVSSGFYLQYSVADNRWAFSRVSSDTHQSQPDRALSFGPPVLGTWTHLVGVYDARDAQLRLYVNGRHEGTTTDTTPFATSGDLAIGRALSGGVPSDWFNGSIRSVKVFNTALTSAQVRALH